MARYTSRTLQLLHALQSADFEGGDYGMVFQAPRWQPRLDMYESADGLVVLVEAAGLDEHRLQLHYEAGQLILEGQRERPTLPAPARCLQVEIDYGSFRRVVPLPPDADGGAINARYEAGLLIITVGRKRAAEASNVRVTVS